MPQQMVDVATRQIVEVPDEEVLAHFQSGKYAFQEGQKLDVVNKYGDTGTIDAREAEKALKKGFTFQTPEEIREKQLAKEYGGVGGTVAAGALGLGRGLTMGLQDPLAIAAAKAIGGQESAESTRKYLREQEEAHPWVSTGTELGGMVLPLLATGGGAGGVEAAGLAARGGIEAAEGAGLVSRIGRGLVTGTEILGAPSRAVAEAGTLAEKMVGAVVGDNSASTVGRLAQKTLSRGASDAVQTALMNVAHEADEATLGDHKLAGDKLWSAVGHGLLFGGGFGLATGAGGVLAKAATTSALEHISPLLKKTAEEQAVRSLSYGGLAPKAFMKNMERLPGGITGVGRELLDSGVIQAGDTFEHIAPRVGAAREEAGATLSGTLKTMVGKGAKTEALPEIISTIRSDAQRVLGKLEDLNTAGYGKVDAAIGSMEKYFKDTPLTLETLRDFRSELDKQINFTRLENPLATQSPALEGLRSVRRSIEGSIESSVEAEGKRLGLDKGLLDIYKAQKLKYARLATAADMVEDSISRANKNAMLGLGEKAMLAAELGGGLAAGHPIAGLVAGVGSAVAGKVIRERGNATAAVLLDKVGDLASVRTSIKAVDRRIAEGIERYFDGKPGVVKAPRLTRAQAAKEYEEAVRVTRSASDPKQVAAYTESHLGSLMRVAPRIASAFQQTASTAALYALSQLPKERKPISFQPQLQKKASLPPTAAEQDKFLRVYRVLNDPASVVDDLANGTLSYDAVQTLKVVNRPLYDEIGKKLQERAIDPAAKPLKTDQLIQGSIFFGKPLADWMKQSSIIGAQNAYQKSGGQQPGGAPPRVASKSTPKSFASTIAEPLKLSGYGGQIGK